ncbi:Predicted membrane protein [Ceraceosorus bombacis]|uniref:Predicted membrane protein n=2 Tax=Ceraceosorus TaxID=401624 RepID=A0A0P1BF60_9BASI|nr:Yos1-like protein [Ceraceosorus guamensis]PWN39538.1 Yos1-like protein [Ceraceosorus guamensis]CEH14680.1 Predicted membrane protein [Ceraceosorus bombacis]
MASTLGSLLYISLLLVNAIAILNEERFLARVGWSTVSTQPNSAAAFDPAGFNGQQLGSEGPGVKARLISLIGAVRMLLRVPLIALNIVVIIYELLLG